MMHEIHCPLSNEPDDDGMEREFIDGEVECICEKIREANKKEAELPNGTT